MGLRESSPWLTISVMRGFAFVVAILLLAGCSGDVEILETSPSSASAVPCVLQCHAMDRADCSGQPGLFFETCVEQCINEAEAQPTECVEAFDAMWECRLREMVVICDGQDEPVSTYEGRCVEESDRYSECAADLITP